MVNCKKHVYVVIETSFVSDEFIVSKSCLNCNHKICTRSM